MDLLIPQTFERLANEALSKERGLIHRWEGSSLRRRRLVLPRQCEDGFEVAAVAETYGLYAFAEGWHSGAWDTPGLTPESLVVDFLGFLRTLLSPDARLDVHYAGRTRSKWIMHYRDESGWQADTTGVLIFNYFGKRTVVTLQNTVLPPRYAETGAVQQRDEADEAREG